MKKRIVLLTMALLMVLPMNAFALEVPTETVVQNLNGSQQVVKTLSLIHIYNAPHRLPYNPHAHQSWSENAPQS